ncbi:MAG: ROK family protein [Propionicimonas sp.]
MAIAGIDIGGTKISALLLDPDARVLARGVVPAPAGDGGGAMADAAAGLASSLAAEAGVRLLAVGAGAAGVIDHVQGTVQASSATFTGWTGFPLATELERRLGVPVRVDNDVNAFLLGEVAFGAGGSDVLGIMLGTGVGGALLLDGRLRHGPHGSAGEIGHIPGYGDRPCTCGQVGHLETLASGTAIAVRYGEATGATGLDAAQVATRARTGDKAAADIFRSAGEAVALAGIATAGLLDLTSIVVGGGVAQAWDLLEPAMTATLAEHPPVSGAELRLQRSRLGGDAVALGAAAIVRELTEPSRTGVR